jgi:hypothetical protein
MISICPESETAALRSILHTLDGFLTENIAAIHQDHSKTGSLHQHVPIWGENSPQFDTQSLSVRLLTYKTIGCLTRNCALACWRHTSLAAEPRLAVRE